MTHRVGNWHTSLSPSAKPTYIVKILKGEFSFSNFQKGLSIYILHQKKSSLVPSFAKGAMSWGKAYL